MALFMAMMDSSVEKLQAEEIYHYYKKTIKYIAISILENEALAEEVVQDVMLAILDHLDQLQEKEMEELRGLIYVLARNCACKKRRNELRFAKNQAALFHPREADPQSFAEHRALMEALVALPDIYRDVLGLSAYYGFSTKEIAKMLKISEVTVRKRLERARGILRADWGEKDE